MREPVTTIASILAAFSGASAAGVELSATAAETTGPAIAPLSSTVASSRAGLLQGPSDACVAPPSTWCCFSILLPRNSYSTSDAPSKPRCGIRRLIMGAFSFQEAVSKLNRVLAQGDRGLWRIYRRNRPAPLGQGSLRRPMPRQVYDQVNETRTRRPRLSAPALILMSAFRVAARDRTMANPNPLPTRL